jgi:Fic family protein
MTVVSRTWPAENGRRFDAFVAPSIAAADLGVSGSTLEVCDRAAGTLSQIGAQPPVAWDPIARLLLRAEGLASSDIEGIRVTPRRLLQAMVADADDQPAQWVLDNIDAVETAYDEAEEDLTTEALLRWHAILMRRSPLPPEYVGTYREVQGWIGGMDPPTAVFVPAPPEFVGELMDDLIGYANRRDLPPVAQAAVLHAQFETIHPFADGNGRVGRALVGWCLRRRGVLARAVPPISPVIARQTDLYVHGLWLYREEKLDAWVTWFAEVCETAAASVASLSIAIAEVQRDWERRLSDLRSDGTARRLLAELPALPIIDVGRAAATLEVSERSARSALTTLEERDVLEPLDPVPGGPGRPRKVWIAGALVDLL